MLSTSLERKPYLLSRAKYIPRPVRRNISNGPSFLTGLIRIIVLMALLVLPISGWTETKETHERSI